MFVRPLVRAIVLALAVIALAGLFAPSFTAARQQHVDLAPGDVVTVTCPDILGGPVAGIEATLVCGEAP